MEQKGKSVLELLREFKKDLKELIGHPMIYKDAYYKELYLIMLSAVAFANGNVDKIEVKFLMCFQNAFKLDGEIISYLNKVSSINQDKVDEFIEFINDEELKYNFLLDGLMLIGLDGSLNEDKVNIIAEFAEIFNIDSEEMAFLCEAAMYILEENTKKFNALIKKIPKKIKAACFRPYVMGFVDVFAIEEEVLEGVTDLTGTFFINNTIIVKGMLRIRDAQIRFGSNGKLVCKTGVELSVQDSEFINGQITCEDIASLNIKNSIFKDCENKRPLLIYECHNDVTISNCKFENSVFNNESDGGCISIINSNVEIVNVQFNNCTVGGKGGALYIKESLEFYKTVELRNLQFNSCNAKNGGAIYLCGEHNKSFSQYAITESIFNNCKAIENGGAVNISSKEYYKTAISKSEFNNCEALLGGGVYSNLGNADISVVNCIFDGCRSENSGSAIFYNEFVGSSDNNFCNVVSNCNNPYNFQ